MNTTELKALAEKAAGWKLDATMQTDDDRDEGIAFVGAINDEGIFSDVARIDTGLYYQPDKAIEVAKFYAAANPAAILELIAQLDDAQGEIRALRATEQALREKAKRWDFLASRMLAADFDYGGEGVQALVFEMPDGFRASADAADTIDRARALLEQKP